MTINTAGFTLGSNQPLNHARILYAPLTGTVSGDGDNPTYAANDYTAQRWQLDPGSNTWTLVTAQESSLDCVFIAAHNLAGKVVTISSSLTENALGPELVTNGTFDTNTTGWTAGNGATLASVAGELEITNGNMGEATQSITVVVGRTYRVTATVTDGTASAGFDIGTPGDADEYGSFTAGAVSADIVATDTTLILTAYVDSVTAAETALFDDISVKLVDAYTQHFTGTIPDNSTICALFNNAGTPYAVRRIRLTVNDGSDVAIGIIRVGAALQLPIPLYGGHRPLNLNRITEAQQQFSETGQWLGRIIKRRAVATTYDWEYLTTAWYDANFEPFAKTLPLQPFCIAGNPSKITTDVGFVWTDRDVEPVNMGINTYRSVSLNVTGYY
jgi:hypothetical protein